MMTLSCLSSLPICSSKSLKHNYYANYNKHINLNSFSYFQTPLEKYPHQVIHFMFPIQNNSPRLHQYTNKHLLNCRFSKSLTKIKSPIIKASKCRSPVKVSKEKTDCMKSPAPEGFCAKNVFQFQPQFLVLTFEIIYQYPIEHATTFEPYNNITRQPYNLSNLLTINLNNESFHNSIEWAVLYRQVNIPSWFEKVFRFTVFRLLENEFCETPPPWHDLTISPPM